MPYHLLHDIFLGTSLALNCLLIIVILTRTPRYLRSYSVVLFYLALVEITSAIASFLLYKKSLSTPLYIINSFGGVCRQWNSPRLCFSLNAVHVGGIAQHAVIIAFCSCYRYYVIAFTRGEPERKTVLLALILIHLPTIAIFINFALCPYLEGHDLERVINESHPEYNVSENREREMLIVVRFDFKARLAVYWVQGIIVPVLIIVIVSYIQINKILASLARMNIASKMRHERILKGLLYQAIIPLLYVVVVASYRIERGKTIRSSKEIGNFTGVIGAILFALSPLFTLIFTPPYRNALKRILHSKYGRTESLITSFNASGIKTVPNVLIPQSASIN